MMTTHQQTERNTTIFQTKAFTVFVGTLILMLVTTLLQNWTFPKSVRLVWQLEAINGSDATKSLIRSPLKTSVDRTSIEDKDDCQAEESPPFWPDRVLLQYKQLHGQGTLQKETIGNFNQRKFSIVYYWCPDRAGNIFHNMFNTIVWSIITNRTILVAFDDSGEARNTKEDCDKVLKLSPWIPQFETWQNKLQDQMDNSYSAPTTIIPLSIDGGQDRYDRDHKIVIFPQIRDVRRNDTMIYRNEWRNDPHDLPQYISVRRLCLYQKRFSLTMKS
jgi:hypothetical protein